MNLQQELSNLASKWRDDAIVMDDLASDEPDDETIMALECRERSRTLRDCAKQLDELATRVQGCDSLPDSIVEALNSGDGVYRP